MSSKTIYLFWAFVCLFVFMENVRIRAPQSCSQRDGLLPFFSLPLPLLLPVCVFLRSPLDLAALAINWFSHLASAFWRMTATACPLCLLKIRIRQPDPTTARERSARPLAYAEKEKVLFLCWRSSRLNRALVTICSINAPWSAHTCSPHTQTQKRWGWKEAQHEWHQCRKGIVDRDN